MNTELVVGSWSSSPQMITSNISDPEPWLIESFGGREAHSGVRVNEKTVLTSGPVYQAVTMIANALSTLPLEVFRDGRTRDKIDKSHPIFKIFNKKGNDEMLAFHVRQTLLGWLLIHGNAVGVIERTGGVRHGVYPVQPGHVFPMRLPATPDNVKNRLADQIVYLITLDDGTTQTYFQHEVFHLKLFGNGLWGESPLVLFKDLFGNGLAMEKFQGKSFANAARPSGLLQKSYGPGIPTKISPEARANLKRDFEDMYAGLDNTGKIALLIDGLEWKPMSVNAEQAQMIESLKFFREQVAAVYNIPPHKLGAMENSAVRANIEEQNRSYVQDTLIPLATIFEQECMEKLCSLREKERNSCVVRHNFKAVLRADIKTRYDAYAIGRQWGWLSANDILDLEDMDQIGPQGNIYMVPANMVDAKTREPFARQPERTQTAPPADEIEPESDETPPTDDNAEQNLIDYARRTLRQKQRIEINNLRRGIDQKQPFEDFLSEILFDFLGRDS